MTHPTKAIYGTLLKDFVKLGRGSTAEEQLFSDEDLQNSLQRIDVVDFHQTVEYNSIKVRCLSDGLRTMGASGYIVGHTLPDL